MNFLDLPLEFKALSDSGTWEGYASVFGNVDLGGDVVERGAFKEIATNKAGQVVALWQHSTRDPIGVATVKEDDTGLHVSGQLVLEDPVARKAHAHMKAGSVRGMSIGYDVLAGGAEILSSGVRRLKALKLWEVSLVTFGMNPLAQITSAKSVGEIITIRDFENYLRDAGFSRTDAAAAASGGWKAVQARRDAGQTIDLSQLAASIAAIQVQ